MDECAVYHKKSIYIEMVEAITAVAIATMIIEINYIN